MARDPAPVLTARTVPNLPQHVAHVSHGAAIMALVVQAAIEDVEGATKAGQWAMAIVQTRHAVLACLHIRGLANGAGPNAFDETVTLDPFVAVPEEEIVAGLDLVHEVRGIRDGDLDGWLARLRRFGAETERQLGLAAPLPQLRSPEGLFGTMRLVRPWAPVLDQLGLPSIVPPDWVTSM